MSLKGSTLHDLFAFVVGLVVVVVSFYGLLVVHVTDGTQALCIIGVMAVLLYYLPSVLLRSVLAGAMQAFLGVSVQPAPVPAPKQESPAPPAAASPAAAAPAAAAEGVPGFGQKAN